jgi:hypothetical protein
MTRGPNTLSRDHIGMDTPLRLAVAATLAYPDGSMTASGLRREAARGRLVIERTAGKDYTTLDAIDEMRKLCRKLPKDRACGSAESGETDRATSPTKPHGSSVTTGDIKKALDAALTTVAGLSKPSPNTSPRSVSRRYSKARVTQIRSPSRT